MNKITITFFYLLIALCFISCEEILIVDDISEKEVSLTAPANNAVLSFSGVTFSWETIDGADKYQLQIAAPSFENPQQIILDTIITKNSYTQQLNIGKYEWRIKAVNSAYESPYKKRSFEILNHDNFQNNTVVLLTPSNNLTTKTALQKLSWDAIIGTVNYQLQILDENNTLVKEQTLETTFTNLSFDEGKYTWKVRANNGTAQTLYTSRSILIDTKVPNTPTLSSPTQASTTTNTNINFQWTRTPITGTAEKDSLYVYNESDLSNLNFKDKGTSPYNKTLTKGTYYWFVKSFDDAGNQSLRSTVFNFTIN
ncbi:hypothetical protein [Flavobacterium reichenbachii]|uniref:Fibronectin type-III domain-containing protein n=1 Tax=Flavobacterium reichenbachii TaxID=362418 RepID=A0A085ZDU8_9FLAO|nr:hypothetical protein [Flavobacterium reichenbachii]KFF02612.1 hypothetical protein IW19_23370 [Flavobacterium reichenbachii]OXB15782.1 hypothetical protein B0A68_08945 [Flavobacterium reichenbachii]